MSAHMVTYLIVGAAAVGSLVAWALLILVPAWTSYWRLRERLLAVVMSLYVLAAFVAMGACVEALFVSYSDRIGAVSQPAQDAAAAAIDLGSLSAISDAVESGLGLPEVVRAAARALAASVRL